MMAQKEYTTHFCAIGSLKTRVWTIVMILYFRHNANQLTVAMEDDLFQDSFQLGSQVGQE